MQLVLADGLVWVVVVGGGAACVVVGGGGGGAAWVVAVGGGAACVVIVAVVAGGGGEVAVCVVPVACVVAAAAFACACALCFGFAGGLPAVVVLVEVVEVVPAVAGALARWVVVEEAAPQALTSSASRMAAAGMRISFMTISLNPTGFSGLSCEDAARPRLLPEGLQNGSEQPMNARPRGRIGT
jgi:hypothetical protein